LILVRISGSIRLLRHTHNLPKNSIYWKQIFYLIKSSCLGGWRGETYTTKQRHISYVIKQLNWYEVIDMRVEEIRSIETLGEKSHKS
jgi:hypothetical protein